MTKKIPANQGNNKAVGYKKPPQATRWKPGQSGNPAGRPKSITLSEAYRKALSKPFPDDPDGRTFAEVIAERMVMAAAGGDVSPAREIADRTEGKPRQALDIDLSVLDWRQMAREFGLSEEDVIREALQLVQSADAGSDASVDREENGG